MNKLRLTSVADTIGPDGTVTMPFTSAGMLRGAVDATGTRRIGIFAEDLTEC